MSTAQIIMDGLLRITIILCAAGLLIRIFDIADSNYFNKKNKDN